MGMKNINALGMIGVLLATSAHENYPEQPQIKANELAFKKPPIKKFHEQENIVKMISEFNKIIKGESNLGSRKQIRIKEKIDAWLESGVLTLEHICEKPETKSKQRSN